MALEFTSRVSDLGNSLPRGCAFLAEQLRRAATSICLNIAEGSGEFSLGEKARFYRMARRSATECAAILDIAELWENRAACDEKGLKAIRDGNNLLLRIVSMLVKMARRCESTQRTSRSKTETDHGSGTGTRARSGTTDHGPPS